MFETQISFLSCTRVSYCLLSPASKHAPPPPLLGLVTLREAIGSVLEKLHQRTPCS